MTKQNQKTLKTKRNRIELKRQEKINIKPKGHSMSSAFLSKNTQ